jgi:Uma2 family endonuclease
MAVHSPQRKLTYQDFERFPDDGQRHEILDGVHVVSPSPTPEHQFFLTDLAEILNRFVRERRLGRVSVAPLDVLLSQHDIVEPDLLFVSTERLGIVGPKNLGGAPDLVAEVLSPGTRRRDLGEKRARYEQLGVQEYWVFDLDAATTQVYRREGTGFLPPIFLAAGRNDLLTTPLLPGLEISLREVFER